MEEEGFKINFTNQEEAGILENYYLKTTSIKPSSVYLCVKCNFISKGQVNVVQAKCNYLEVLAYVGGKVEVYYSVPVEGQISNLTRFQSNKYDTDLIFVLLADGSYFNLVYDISTCGIKTLNVGKVEVNLENPLPNGVVAAVDGESRVLAFSSYGGSIKVLGLNKFEYGSTNNNQRSEFIKMAVNLPSTGSIKLNTDMNSYLQRFSIPISNILSLVFVPFKFPVSELPPSDVAILAILHASPRLNYNLITFYEYSLEFDSLQKLKLDSFLRLLGVKKDFDYNQEVPELKVQFEIQSIQCLANGSIVGVGDHFMTYFDPLKLMLDRFRPLNKLIDSAAHRYQQEIQTKLGHSDSKSSPKRSVNSTQPKQPLETLDLSQDLDRKFEAKLTEDKNFERLRVEEEKNLEGSNNEMEEEVAHSKSQESSSGATKRASDPMDEYKAMIMVPRIMERKLSRVNCFVDLEANYPLLRLLVGSSDGKLTIVEYKESFGDRLRVRMELEDRSIPTNLISLPNHHVYLPSHLSDHQLIRFKPKANQIVTTTVQSFTSLSPITDMHVLHHSSDISGRRYDEVILGSGGLHCGKIHVIRSGAKYTYHQRLPLPDVVEMFGFTLKGRRVLAACFINNTRLLELPDGGNELEYVTEIQVEGFDYRLEEESVYVGTFQDLLVRVTAHRIRVVDADRNIDVQWVPQIEARAEDPDITVVSKLTDAGYLAIACQKRLFLLQVGVEKGIELVNEQLFEDEVSVLELRDSTDPSEPYLLAISYWNNSDLIVFTMPNLQPFIVSNSPSQSVVTSLLFHTFEQLYLLIATSDGRITFRKVDVPGGTLGPANYVAPGTIPCQLVPQPNGNNVILVCDRPAILHPSSDSGSGGLGYTFLNAKDPTHSATFLPATPTTQEILVFADKEVVILGNLEASRSLETKTTVIGLSPKVLIPHPKLPILIGLTASAPKLSGSNGNVPTSRNEVSELVVFSQPDMHVVSRYPFDSRVVALSMAIINARPQKEEDAPTIVIGTTAKPSSRHCNTTGGVLRTFQIHPITFAVEFGFEQATEVPPLFIEPFPLAESTFLVATGSFLSIYQLFDFGIRPLTNSKILTPTQIVSLAIQTYQGKSPEQKCKVLLGDLVESTTLVQYNVVDVDLNHTTRNLTSSILDRKSSWIATLHTLDFQRYLVADCEGRVSIYKVLGEGIRADQELVGSVQVYDLVNCATNGSIAIPLIDFTNFNSQSRLPLLSSFQMEEAECCVNYQPTMLATVSGAIITINPLPKFVYDVLQQLTIHLRRVLGTVGTSDGNGEERRFNVNFIDLDFVLLFLQLDASLQDSILEGKEDLSFKGTLYLTPDAANNMASERIQLVEEEGPRPSTADISCPGLSERIPMNKTQLVRLLQSLNQLNGTEKGM